jgi:segregation and condensation protein B
VPQPAEAAPPPAEPVADSAATPPPTIEAEPTETEADEPEPDPEPDVDDLEPAAIDQPAEDEEPDTPFDKLASRAKRFSAERTRTILESLLLVTDRPLTSEAIRACTGLEPAVIKEQLEKLQGFYRDGVRGIVLNEVAGGWQFRTCPSTSEFVRRFLKVKPHRLTRAALETLAIIAYRQPVTRPEVEDIRAVDSGAVIKALLDRQLIKILGKKEEPGRPLLYGSTPQFLEFFNLRDLASLPTLREFQELTEESQQIVEQQAADSPAPKGTEGLVADLHDQKLEERLGTTTAEADAALADLETAIADSDLRTRETVRILRPVPPPAPEGAPAGSGSAPAPEDLDRPAPDDADDDDEGPLPE